jgi:hypothetical protein
VFEMATPIQSPMTKVGGSVATIRIKNFPIGLRVMYFYFPDTPLILGLVKLREMSWKGMGRELSIM